MSYEKIGINVQGAVKLQNNCGNLNGYMYVRCIHCRMAIYVCQVYTLKNGDICMSGVHIEEWRYMYVKCTHWRMAIYVCQVYTLKNGDICMSGVHIERNY